MANDIQDAVIVFWLRYNNKVLHYLSTHTHTTWEIWRNNDKIRREKKTHKKLFKWIWALIRFGVINRLACISDFVLFCWCGLLFWSAFVASEVRFQCCHTMKVSFGKCGAAFAKPVIYLVVAFILWIYSSIVVFSERKSRHFRHL